MESDDKLRLLANRDFLVQNVQADEIIDYLVSEQVLTEDDVERISNQDTSRNKVRKILDTLPKRGPLAYGAFKSALEENQDYIVKRLDDTDINEAKRKRDAMKAKNHRDETRPVQAEASADSNVAVGPSLFLELSGEGSMMQNWKNVARRLGVPESDIVDIVNRDRDNLKEQTYQSLIAWQDRKGDSASIDSLVKGLRACRLNAVIDNVVLPKKK